MIVSRNYRLIHRPTFSECVDIYRDIVSVGFSKLNTYKLHARNIREKIALKIRGAYEDAVFDWCRTKDTRNCGLIIRKLETLADSLSEDEEGLYLMCGRSRRNDDRLIFYRGPDCRIGEIADFEVQEMTAYKKPKGSVFGTSIEICVMDEGMIPRIAVSAKQKNFERIIEELYRKGLVERK